LRRGSGHETAGEARRPAPGTARRQADGKRVAMNARMVRVRSQEAFQRACRLMPGGVNSPARAFGAVGGQPLFIARGEGAYLYDLDGNRYLDYVGSWGPLILGHSHPRVVKAL